MSKYLVLVGFESMDNWENCAELCAKPCNQMGETNGLCYSKLIDCKLNDNDQCKILLIHQQNEGKLGASAIEGIIQEIFRNTGTQLNPQDEIILYCHEYHSSSKNSGHDPYGTTEAELQKLSVKYQNLYFAFFKAELTPQTPEPTSKEFPFKVITDVNDTIRSKKPFIDYNWDDLLKPCQIFIRKSFENLFNYLKASFGSFYYHLNHNDLSSVQKDVVNCLYFINKTEEVCWAGEVIKTEANIQGRSWLELLALCEDLRNDKQELEKHVNQFNNLTSQELNIQDVKAWMVELGEKLWKIFEAIGGNKKDEQ